MEENDRRLEDIEKQEKLEQEFRIKFLDSWGIKKQRPGCPKCGSRRDIIPILYGLFELGSFQKRALLGAVLFGGCVSSYDSPCWHCRKCKNNFK
ncbi:hypothetical protein A3K73_05055 [Candidatus Pacearchaeota archaeon RBG_13_36_9]|nr:MAG: hypothetical protein A3K73_05055 [Candidatus Pacearchaeota archaeon RBG_13_36_9]HJX50797.1 hypothetical protein [Candidatus Nanoarchaeia archaeon]